MRLLSFIRGGIFPFLFFPGPSGNPFEGRLYRARSILVEQVLMLNDAVIGLWLM